MGLLFCDAHFGQRVQNGLALDFQLSGQIVDSNLTHPPFLFSGLSAKSSYQPHGVGFLCVATCGSHNYSLPSEVSGSAAASPASSTASVTSLVSSATAISPVPSAEISTSEGATSRPSAG